jgi:F0F1-type ATP synthase assembly protein I
MGDLEQSKKQLNKYLRFSSIAIQMGVVIGGLAYLGVWLDKKYNPGGNTYTLVCTLFGVGASMYLVIKEVIKMSKENDE